jgi:hypothetical protein
VRIASCLLPVLRLGLLVSACGLAACTGLGKEGSAKIPNPVGPINTGGAPDLGKTNGKLSAGGDPNAGGAPDPSKTNTGGAPDPGKTNGTVGTGGPANTGGRPDVSKSVPKKK